MKPGNLEMFLCARTITRDRSGFACLEGGTRGSGTCAGGREQPEDPDGDTGGKHGDLHSVRCLRFPFQFRFPVLTSAEIVGSTNN